MAARNFSNIHNLQNTPSCVAWKGARAALIPSQKVSKRIFSSPDYSLVHSSAYSSAPSLALSIAHTQTQTQTHADTDTDRQTDRQTDDRQTDRQRGRFLAGTPPLSFACSSTCSGPALLLWSACVLARWPSLFPH